MKKKILPIAGITSMVVLIAVQIFIIGQIWQQKNELFLLNNRQLSQQAITFYDTEYRINGFETALDLLDDYSQGITLKDEKLFRKEDNKQLSNTAVLKEVNKLISSQQELSGLLTKYFRSHSADGNIKSFIDISNFDLLDFNLSYNLYNRTDQDVPPPVKGLIHVNRFKMESNYYRITFDYYIDITDKREILFREMSISFVLSTLSILIVLFIFLMAYRYLMEEKRLSDLKTDFINNMTHELKTPLSTITVASKTLELDQIIDDRDKIISMARMIGKQSLNLNHLINLILEISIWERTEFEADFKQVEVGPMLEEIVECFRAGYKEDTEIKSNIALEGVTIKADITYFTTMINNLLSNAVKFSRDNCKIMVNAKTDGSNILISITDNGIGISKSDQRHIFDKFYRVSHGDLHKTKGLGLGLYYVSRIAAAHNGTVELVSQPGKGSTFTVIIPIQQS